MALFFRRDAARRAGDPAEVKDVALTATVEPAVARATPRPLSELPLVRAGVYAWAAAGLTLVLIGGATVVGRLTVVFVPLVLAMFPAAVLMPPNLRLRRAGVPRGIAALIVLLGFIGLIAGVVNLLVPPVAAEVGNVGDALGEGYEEFSAFLASGPFGFEPVRLDETVAQLRAQLTSSGDVSERVGEAAVVAVEVVAGFALLLFALFFYLKDGERIARWLQSLFPAALRADAAEVGDRVWSTIGAYIRGQLVIALFDAVVIGIGLLLLRVPLALPLAALVFFGALFPIVGAFLAGAVAVLVALATGGPGLAVATLVLIVVVQQVEGHVLAPVVLGRATELHPLAVIAALTAGAVLLGVLGAFLAVPVAASVARVVGYLRSRPPVGAVPTAD